MGCTSAKPAPAKQPAPQVVAAKKEGPTVEVTFHQGKAVPKQTFQKDYQMQRKLGKGNYSEVRLAVHRQTRQKYAVKVVTKSTLQQEDLDALYVEVEVLLKLEHPNVVNLIAFYEDDTKFYLVMELMTGGELFQRIVQKSKYTESEARDLVRTLTMAVNYCHEQGVMHRDLKPENVLLASKDEDADVKLADFGFAKKFHYESEHAFQTSCGTPGYVAPEIISKTKYGREVDIWSLGVIFYILLCGYPPFMANDMSTLFRLIRKAKYEFDDEGWSDISDEAKDLISKILVADPKKRFTPHQILNHKWITQKTCRTLPLTHTMANLKAFNARRRFKNAVNVVRAAHLFSRAGPTTVGGNTGAARKLGDLTEGDEGEEEAAIAAAEAEEAAAEAEVAAAAAATAGAGAGAGGGAGAPAGKSDKFDKSDRFDAALY